VFLFPVHIVFLEFVIDPACSIVFEAEDSDARVMQRPPRDPRDPLFKPSMLAVSLSLGVSSLLAVLAVYAWALHGGRPESEVHALAFATIVFSNLWMIHATRSRDLSILGSLGKPNPALWWVTAGALSALAVTLYVPAAAAIFRFAPLGFVDVLITAAAGLAGVLWYDFYKRRRTG
jgi:Ca2+-transporting ATPase